MFTWIFLAVTFLLPLSGRADSIPLVSGTFSNIAGERSYDLYIPPNFNLNSGKDLPLIILLHGCGQNSLDLLRGTDFNKIADSEQFFILLPVQDRAHNTLACWNWYLPEHQVRDGGEPSIILGMVDKVVEEYHMDKSRIYLAGFSSGAAMASTIASCYPDKIAAVAIHSGLNYLAASSMLDAFQAMSMGSTMPPDQSAEAGYRCASVEKQLMPTIIFHGAGDTIVSLANGRQIFSHFTKLNDLMDDGQANWSINAESASLENVHNPGTYFYTISTIKYQDKALIKYFVVQNMSHAWSGGNNQVQHMDPAGPKATTLVWEFFKGYSRGGNIGESDTLWIDLNHFTKLELCFSFFAARMHAALSNGYPKISTLGKCRAKSLPKACAGV